MNRIIFFTLILINALHVQAEKYKSNNTLDIKCSKIVPKDQCKLIDKDLAVLKTLNVEDTEQDVLRHFKIAASAANYETWLSDRVNYIIPETFEISKSISIIQNSYIYPNSILPELEIGQKVESSQPQNKVVTVMSNIGTALYFAGKQSGSLMGVDLPGIGVIPVYSPRIGLIKIGVGHFLPLLRKSGGTEFDTYANSLHRLSTFIHEARHSDGNAKSLGFFHAICPIGHNFAGYNACDRNLNGPYTMGATFLKSIVNNCITCSEPEKEALRNVYMDSYSRVIMETAAKPATSSSEFNSLKESCDILKKYGSTADLSFCDRIDTPDVSNSSEIIPSLELDDTPEFGSTL